MTSQCFRGVLGIRPSVRPANCFEESFSRKLWSGDPRRRALAFFLNRATTITRKLYINFLNKTPGNKEKTKAQTCKIPWRKAPYSKESRFQRRKNTQPNSTENNKIIEINFNKNRFKNKITLKGPQSCFGSEVQLSKFRNVSESSEKKMNWG